MAKTPDKPADDEATTAKDPVKKAAGEAAASAKTTAGKAAAAAKDAIDDAKDDATEKAATAAKKTQEAAKSTAAAAKDDATKASATAKEAAAEAKEAATTTAARVSADAEPASAGQDISATAYGDAPSMEDAASFAYAPPVQAATRRRLPGEHGIGQVFAAEIFGAFVLVLAGLGIGMYNGVTSMGGLAVALGFGFGVMASAYAFGWISGGHFNPAVTLGAALAGRVRWARVPAYWLAQLIGSLLAAGLLWVVRLSLTGAANIDAAQLKTFKDQMFKSVANGWGSGATGSAAIQFSWVTALLAEIVVTMVFVLVILGSTSKRANSRFAPFAIGMTLAVGLMILMPITNGSMNPTRSLAAALFAGGQQLEQVWLFILAPLVGGALGGLLYPLFAGFGPDDEK